MIKHQISNNPFISLDNHIDITGLKSIEKNIVLGIVKSKNNITDAGAAKANFYPSEIQIKSQSLQDISWPEQVKNPNQLYYEQYKELNFDNAACRMFNRYMYNTIQMGQALSLRTHLPKQFLLKDSAEHCFDTNSIKNFPELMDWIQNLTIFKEIGRIIFFFNAPYDKHAVHKDHNYGIREQFILINLNPERKEFFILDEAGEKLVVENNVILFDPRNYHGTEGKTYYGWTLRIDGKFNVDWLKSMNLFNHYYPPT